MLVCKLEEGASLARALGQHWMVLMNRHGVTVAGTSVKDCVFRCVYSARNADYQVRALTIGDRIASLSPGETQMAGNIVVQTTRLTRSWEYWSMRVAKAGGAVPAEAKSSKTVKSTKKKPAATQKKKSAARRK
jgi:HCOMODA/2-hydroxy-3-carboxy-muconic semialdehyde decarboxylase